MTLRPSRIRMLVCAAVLALLAPALHGSAQVPGRVDFQGLLLDSAGDPVNGLVDLEFALFDVATGGTASWGELHADVSVVDGVYDVALGSVVPLTPALLATTPVYLEITVDGETLSPRRELLAVPFALRAAEADSAQGVGGFSSGYFSQMVENFAFDGGDPPNTDATEGLADVDGDGVANFLDADNDDDGLSDPDELAQGSHVNLVTPIVTGFSPPSAPAAFPATVTIQGTNFASGLTVQFGAESPAPTNVTSTSFDVSVGQAPVGDATVVVTLSNGESDASTYPRAASLAIAGVTPDSVLSIATTLVTITGEGFGPGVTVEIGSETPAPMNVTATSLQVQVGPQAGGTVPLEVSLPNGEVAASTFEFRDYRRVLPTGPVTGNIGGLAAADALCAQWAENSGIFGLTFLPWLADASDSPATRFVQSTLPYRRLDGTQIADDWADLVDGTLDARVVAAGGAAWANVAIPSATGTGTSCLDWTSTSALETGRGGNAAFPDDRWTDDLDSACNIPRILYCFEQ